MHQYAQVMMLKNNDTSVEQIKFVMTNHLRSLMCEMLHMEHPSYIKLLNEELTVSLVDAT
jgi:hypothetical protein